MRSMHRQRGIVLVIGLMMLVLLTLMAIAALRFGTSNFAMVANQQTRAEAVRAAEQVIEQIIENPDLSMTGGANLFGTGSNTVNMDINGDGVPDYTVVVTAPVCVKQQVIPQLKLDLAKEEDLGCSRGVDPTALGIEGATTGDSVCSEVTFDVTATASDAFRQNNVAVTQGIGQRVSTNKIAAVCM